MKLCDTIRLYKLGLKGKGLKYDPTEMISFPKNEFITNEPPAPPKEPESRTIKGK